MCIIRVDVKWHVISDGVRLRGDRLDIVMAFVLAVVGTGQRLLLMRR